MEKNLFVIIGLICAFFLVIIGITQGLQKKTAIYSVSVPVAGIGQSRDFGNCVYFLDTDNFGKTLSEFKKAHPDLEIHAIAFVEEKNFIPDGFWVSCEKK